MNAIDALGRGGTVTIAARRSADGVELSVKDTGPGIPESIQPNIFEPFFSTKDNQHRTGLGLAIAKNIVQKHGGEISLRSRPGEGAEFLIVLPPVAPPEPPPAKTSEVLEEQS